MVAIRLCSAASISTLFVVSLALKSTPTLLLLYCLNKTRGLRKEHDLSTKSVETFEVFLEAVEEAPFWNKGDGKLSFRLHLKSMV